MSDLKEKKFGYIVNNQPCPGHFHPPYPPMPPPIPGVTMKDLIQYVNSYIDVRAKQIYEKIKEHQGGIDKQEIIDAVIAQFRDEIGNEVKRYIENHVNFEQLIREQIQGMDFLTPSSSEFTQLKSSIGSLNGQVASLSASVQGFGQSISSLSNSVASLSGAVNGLTASMNTLTGDVADLKSQMVNVITASALNDRLESYATNDRVDGISSDVEQLKASASTFASKAYVDASISALSEDVAELSASLTSYATKEYVAAEIAKINSSWDESGL